MCPSFKGAASAGKRTMMRLVYERLSFWALAVGYGFFIFFVGGLAFWGPSMLSETYGGEQADASLLFGVTTVTTGILGTLIGGKLVDIAMKRRSENSILSNDAYKCYVSAKISAILLLLAIPFCVLAVFMRSISQFIGVISVGMLLLFTTTAPCNIAILNSVPEAARGQAMGLSVTISHILGDIPSPFVIGLLKTCWSDKKVGNFWTMIIANIALALAAGVWVLAFKIAAHEGKKFADDYCTKSSVNAAVNAAVTNTQSLSKI